MVIREEYRLFLSQFIDNLDEMLEKGNLRDLLLAIDDAMLDTLDADYNPNADGTKMQYIYDEIYVENVE